MHYIKKKSIKLPVGVRIKQTVLIAKMLDVQSIFLHLL